MVHVFYSAVIFILLVLLIIEVRKPKCRCHHKKGSHHGGCSGCGGCRD